MAAPTNVPDIIERYFQQAINPDQEQYFALFADDAHVEDDGQEYHGIDEIRAWRTSIPKVVYRVTDLEPVDDGMVVTAEVSGDFPGSPVSLRFQFADYDDERIRSLRIGV